MGFKAFPTAQLLRRVKNIPIFFWRICNFLFLFTLCPIFVFLCYCNEFRLYVYVCVCVQYSQVERDNDGTGWKCFVQRQLKPHSLNLMSKVSFWEGSAAVNVKVRPSIFSLV